ncbi:MAG: CoA pyrophosphatase [Gammaproteobacteria bacterium]|nr:CoA pyrophosphatase [Gammaproteobacteria bacterium]NND37394.1 CoA pyrophosphatase [Gammaproteobacteria bacterium]
MRKRIERRLGVSTLAADPVAAALDALPSHVSAAWFDKPLIPAAVLVPLVTSGDAIAVLLTQRTTHLKDHPGQISFPGGRAEPGDAGAVDTALREVHEEIGIAPEAVNVVGYMDPLAVVTGFAVTPVVGFVEGDYTLELDAYEVEEAFEVPLDFLLDAANEVPTSRTVRGIEARFYEYHFEGRRIWGATAVMIKNFIDIIK